MRRRRSSFDLEQYLERHIAWSSKNFGPGPRTKGLIAHLRKELEEIERKPADVFEWVDLVILAFDGAWRAGYKPKQIVKALKTKQETNFVRNWPKPVSQDLPVEHVRSLPGKPVASKRARRAFAKALGLTDAGKVNAEEHIVMRVGTALRRETVA